MAPLRRPPPLAAVFTRLLPVSASFAASLFLGNVAYLGLSGDCLLLLAGMLVCVGVSAAPRHLLCSAVHAHLRCQVHTARRCLT
jgi:hypothetical protein